MSFAPVAAPRAGTVWRAAIAGLCALLLANGLGRFGYTPLIPALIENGWFSAEQADYLGAINLTGYLLGAITARRATQYVSAPSLIVVAMAIGSITFFACAFKLGFEWYFVWRMLSGVMGGWLMVLTASTVLAHPPRNRIGLIGGIIFAGVGIGIVMSGTMVPALVRFGLREAWLGFGLVGAALTVAAMVCMPRHIPVTVGKPSPGTGKGSLSVAIVLLLVYYGFHGIGLVPHTVFWVDYIVRGMEKSLSVGGYYWVIFGLGAVFGPPLTGVLADRVGFKRSLTLSALVMTIGVGLPVISDGTFALAASSLLVGGVSIGFASLVAGRVSELVAPDVHRQVWGWMTIAFSVGQAGGAFALSFLFDRTGSFTSVFAIGAVVLAGGLCLTMVGPGGGRQVRRV